MRRYLCDDRVLSDDRVAAILAESDADDALGLGLWVIETACEAFAGSAGLQRIDPGLAEGTSAVGLWEPAVAVRPALFGQGLGRRALARLMVHACEGAGLSALGALCDEPNVASRRMLERCGFAEVGRRRGANHPLIVWRAELRRLP